MVIILLLIIKLTIMVTTTVMLLLLLLLMIIIVSPIQLLPMVSSYINLPAIFSYKELEKKQIILFKFNQPPCRRIALSKQ